MNRCGSGSCPSPAEVGPGKKLALGEPGDEQARQRSARRTEAQRAKVERNSIPNKSIRFGWLARRDDDDPANDLALQVIDSNSIRPPSLRWDFSWRRLAGEKSGERKEDERQQLEPSRTDSHDFSEQTRIGNAAQVSSTSDRDRLTRERSPSNEAKGEHHHHAWRLFFSHSLARDSFISI